MATAAAPGAAPSQALDRDQRMVVHGVTWKEYLILNDAIDTPGVRMSYCEGALELMTVSGEHERDKKMIARLIELWALERDIPLYGYGSTTFRNEMKQRGAEPDECWVVGGDLIQYPEIVLEVVHTHGGIDKLDVYRGMAVAEVWFWIDGGFQLFRLGEDGYRAIGQSESLPAIDFEQLTRFVKMADQHAALKALVAHLRANPG